jgi:hypothetical protein
MNKEGTEALRLFLLERNRLLGLISLVVEKLRTDVDDDLAQLTGRARGCPELCVTDFEAMGLAGE